MFMIRSRREKKKLKVFFVGGAGGKNPRGRTHRFGEDNELNDNDDDEDEA